MRRPEPRLLYYRHRAPPRVRAPYAFTDRLGVCVITLLSAPVLIALMSDALRTLPSLPALVLFARADRQDVVVVVVTGLLAIAWCVALIGFVRLVRQWWRERRQVWAAYHAYLPPVEP